MILPIYFVMVAVKATNKRLAISEMLYISLGNFKHRDISKLS